MAQQLGGAGFSQSDTNSTIASALFTFISGNGSSPVSASLSGATITLTAKTTGSATNYPLSVTMSHNTTFFPNPSFTIAPSGSVLTGGTDPQTTYDSGWVSATVGGFTPSPIPSYGSASNVNSVATALVNAFNVSGSPVTATANGAVVTFTSVATGPGANYSGSDSSGSTNGFSPPSFSAVATSFNLTGGTPNSPGPWTLATPAVTLYGYDVLGNMTCVVQKNTDTTLFTASLATCPSAPAAWRPRWFNYDALSRLVGASNPESGPIVYAYDLNGNVASKMALSPNQPQTGTGMVTTSYLYDALNRVTKKSYADSYGSNPATAAVQYGYDGTALMGCAIAAPSLTENFPVGARTSMCDGSGATSWAHDKMGRVKWERRAIGKATVNHNVFYTPNLDGSLGVLQAPPMKTLNYTYSGAGRATTLVDSGDGLNFATNAQYTAPGQPAGALMSVTLGSVFNVSNAYNVRMQQLLLSATGPAGTVFSECLDFHSVIATPSPCPFSANPSGDNGNMFQVVNNRDGTRTQSFTYDGLNRIGGLAQLCRF